METVLLDERGVIRRVDTALVQQRIETVVEGRWCVCAVLLDEGPEDLLGLDLSSLEVCGEDLSLRKSVYWLWRMTLCD